jgi:hypothetical protein
MPIAWRLRGEDIRFLLETVASHVDPDGVHEWNEAWLEEVLSDDQVFDRLVNSREFLLQVSPWLYFNVLLRRARQDLEAETFTMERRSRQKVVLFDTNQVTDLLGRPAIRDYLSGLLASFTRVASMTVRVNVGRGVWRRYRTNDLDVEGMMRYAEAVEAPFRFEPYKRIGDVCLFMTGMFTEHIETRHRYAASRQIRPGSRGRLLQQREDYERYGRAFYRLAAEHERAAVGGLDEVLETLSENFLLAEKPLAFLSQRYLWANRHQLFGF